MSRQGAQSSSVVVNPLALRSEMDRGRSHTKEPAPNEKSDDVDDGRGANDE